MKELIPYLMFPGNCEEAINFYKDGIKWMFICPVEK